MIEARTLKHKNEIIMKKRRYVNDDILPGEGGVDVDGQKLSPHCCVLERSSGIAGEESKCS
jgi:hypothetical protein